MSVRWAFIEELEGRRAVEGYVPDSGGSRSGVTVASGVDLGQRTAAEIDALAIPETLKRKLKPYAGLRGGAAVAFLRARPLAIDAAEAKALDRAVRAEAMAALVRAYDRAVAQDPSLAPFDALPEAAQTVIASVAFQYGTNLSARTPRFWNAVVTQDWTAAAAELETFGDRYPTRRRTEAALLKTILV